MLVTGCFQIGDVPLFLSGGEKMVKVNGEEKDIAGKTLAEYFATTKYDMKRVATEINGEIVPKAQYAQTVYSVFPYKICFLYITPHKCCLFYHIIL